MSRWRPRGFRWIIGALIVLQQPFENGVLPLPPGRPPPSFVSAQVKSKAGSRGTGLHTFVLTCFVQVCLVGTDDYLAVSAAGVVTLSLVDWTVPIGGVVSSCFGPITALSFIFRYCDDILRHDCPWKVHQESWALVSDATMVFHLKAPCSGMGRGRGAGRGCS